MSHVSAINSPSGQDAQFNYHIKLAADTVERLRKCDVFRVLDHVVDVGSDVKALGAYIVAHREDLADEVSHVLLELLPEA